MGISQFISIGKAITLGLQIFLIFLKDRKDPEKAFARALEGLVEEYDNLSNEMSKAVHKKDIDSVRNLISDLQSKRMRTDLTKDEDRGGLFG